MGYWSSKHSGGAREGAGRPRIGVKKAVTITLPAAEWERIAEIVKDGHAKSVSDYFRQLHLAQQNE